MPITRGHMNVFFVTTAWIISKLKTGAINAGVATWNYTFFNYFLQKHPSAHALPLWSCTRCTVHSGTSMFQNIAWLANTRGEKVSARTSLGHSHDALVTDQTGWFTPSSPSYTSTVSIQPHEARQQWHRATVPVICTVCVWLAICYCMYN